MPDALCVPAFFVLEKDTACRQTLRRLPLTFDHSARRHHLNRNDGEIVNPIRSLSASD
ncbi:MAG TPA: hypothetical protein VGI60_00335 [Chthoniobacterales bacterium]|jgi:hypothetical protein